MTTLKYQNIIIEMRDLGKNDAPTGPSTYITGKGYIDGLDTDGMEIIWLPDSEGVAYRTTKGLDIP